MKKIVLFLSVLLIVFPVVAQRRASKTTAAQRPADVLATSTVGNITIADLPDEVKAEFQNLPEAIAKTRTAVLEQMIVQRALDLEAKERGLSTGAMLGGVRGKVPDPTADEIKKVIDANAAALSGFSPDEARLRVIAYLRSGPEQKALVEFVNGLRTKFKATGGKDINAKLLPTDIVATVGGQNITFREFEAQSRIAEYDLKAGLAEIVTDELDQLIFDKLLQADAKALGIDAGDLIAREITNKMKDFSDEERYTLEGIFVNGLHKKYKVNILYKEPDAPVEAVSTDGDPSTGPVTAAVTVIMFSDFQCSACAATHPVLKQAMSSFPGKIRFVVRDFPLESIHENAFNAALAAGAADAQGKFFEYIDLLYRNQDDLAPASLKRYAAEIGLNVERFELDFKSEKIAAEVRKDMADGNKLGINSTPTVFVNGRRLRRNSPEAFTAAIERAMKK